MPAELRLALDNDQIELRYQPKANTRTGAPEGLDLSSVLRQVAVTLVARREAAVKAGKQNRSPGIVDETRVPR
jgi:hypothetical protein